MEYIFIFMLMALVIVLGILIIRIPVVIAKNKNLDEGELSTITLLSWLGILLGITWVIALVFALVWQGNALSDVSNLDKLERISKLYKDKVISKKEYEAMKNKLLGIK